MIIITVIIINFVNEITSATIECINYRNNSKRLKVIQLDQYDSTSLMYNNCAKLKLKEEKHVDACTTKTRAIF